MIDSVIEKIVCAFKENNKKVDFILFTGDLVYSATVRNNFNLAKTKLYDYLSFNLNVPADNIIFCPGNHDIDRESKHEGVLPFLNEKVNSSKDLNDFYQKKKDVYKDSLRTLANYNQFAKSFHSSADNVFSDLYSIHYRTYNDEKLVFVSLYTPWLSAVWDDKGDLDEGNLCLPVKALDELLRSIEGKAERKIVLMHHPISALKKYLTFEVEDRIYNNFDMFFTGHIHKIMSVARHDGENGLFEHTAKATLTKGATIGCSFIENIDYEPNKFLVYEITYVKDSNECHFGSAVEVTIPVGEEKAEQIRLRSKIHDRIEPELLNANTLLLQNDDDDVNAFLTKFNDPHIKTQREDTSNSFVASAVSMDEFYLSDTNILIYGKDKCGKSSLLRRIQLEYLMHYTTYQRIPLYLDAKQESSKVDDKYNIDLILRSELAINRAQTTKIANSDKLVLLIDNFRPDDAFCNYLSTFIKTHPDCGLYLATDDNVSNSLQIDNLEFIKKDVFRRVYFHSLRRQEIVKYTDASLSDKENKEAVQEKIMKLCKQMELPFNYWTISLFLLIHHKSSDTYSKNLFSILDYCVDEIFDKKRFLVQEAQITFPQIKMLSASLAAYLFENHEDYIYSATEQEIINFLNIEIDKNVRIGVSSKMVFDFLNGCGMLKGQENGRYCFRLNGFFEYFLAYHMTKDVEFKERILSNDVKYLGFRNQLEIYSGLKNDDAVTLKRVYEKTIAKCLPLFAKYGDDKDAQLKTIVEVPQKVEEDLKQLSVEKALTPMEKAMTEDIVEGVVELKSDVHLIYQYDPNSNKTDVVERYLSILSRVYKNIDNVSNLDVDIRQIFKTIIDYYCDFGFYLVENLADEAKETLRGEDTAILDETEEMKLLKLMSNFSPVISQSFLYDGLGHYSLVRLLKMEIERLRVDSEKNQYRLFLLYFTLFDIALSENYKMIDQAIEDISKMPLLRYMIYIKVNYYLAFKSYGNNQMANYLQETAKKTKLLLDNKTDVGRLQQALSDTRKTALVVRNE